MPHFSDQLKKTLDSSTDNTFLTKERQKQKSEVKKRSEVVGNTFLQLFLSHSTLQTLSQYLQACFSLLLSRLHLDSFSESLTLTSAITLRLSSEFCYPVPFNPLHATNHFNIILNLASFLQPFRNSAPVFLEPLGI